MKLFCRAVIKRRAVSCGVSTVANTWLEVSIKVGEYLGICHFRLSVSGHVVTKECTEWHIFSQAGHSGHCGRPSVISILLLRSDVLCTILLALPVHAACELLVGSCICTQLIQLVEPYYKHYVSRLHWTFSLICCWPIVYFYHLCAWSKCCHLFKCNIYCMSSACANFCILVGNIVSVILNEMVVVYNIFCGWTDYNNCTPKSHTFFLPLYGHRLLV